MAQEGRYYRVTLMTPRKIFAPDPQGEASAEGEYHAAARERFSKLLAKTRPLLERAVDELRREWGARLPLLPFDAARPPCGEGPGAEACQQLIYLSFPELGTLELTLAHPLDPAAQERLRLRVNELFNPRHLAPAQTGDWYRLILPLSSPFTVDKAGAIHSPPLDGQRAQVTAHVDLLRRELGAQLHLRRFDPALPLLPPAELGGGSRSPCRIDLIVALPGDGGLLELAVAQAPTADQLQALTQRANELFATFVLEPE